MTNREAVEGRFRRSDAPRLMSAALTPQGCLAIPGTAFGLIVAFAATWTTLAGCIAGKTDWSMVTVSLVIWAILAGYVFAYWNEYHRKR